MRIILLSLIISMNTFGFSQIRIAIEDELNDTSGYVLEYAATTPLNSFHLYDLRVHNESDIDQEWMITRRVISQPEGWTNYICWGPAVGGGACYPSNSDLEWSSDAFPIESGEFGKLSIYINAPFEGSSLCRYYISTDGIDYIDSIDIHITQTVGITANFVENKISFFPNPASETIQIISPIIEAYQMQIINLQGKLIMNIDLKSYISYIDISSISAGNYFVLFRDEEGVEVIEKLIIK